MKRRFVIVGNGLIGTAVARWAAEHSQATPVMVVRRPHGGEPRRADLVQLDSSDQRLVGLRGVVGDGDVVVAAYGPASPRLPLSDVSRLLTTFSESAVGVVEAVERRQGNLVVNFSSGGEVYEPSASALDESARLRPSSAYGVAKVAEELIMQQAASASANVVSLRCSTVYGVRPRQRADQGLVDLAIRRVGAGDPITLFERGTSERGYLHVDDLAAAVGLVAELPNPDSVYNACSGEYKTSSEVVAMVGRRLQSKPIVEFDDRPDRSTLLDPSLLHEILPKGHFRPLEVGIAELCDTRPAND